MSDPVDGPDLSYAVPRSDTSIPDAWTVARRNALARAALSGVLPPRTPTRRQAAADAVTRQYRRIRATLAAAAHEWRSW